MTTNIITLCRVLEDMVDMSESRLQTIANNTLAERVAIIHDYNCINNIHQDCLVQAQNSILEKNIDFDLHIQVVPQDNCTLAVLHCQHPQIVELITQHPKVELYQHTIQSNTEIQCLIEGINPQINRLHKHIPDFKSRCVHAAMDACYVAFIELSSGTKPTPEQYQIWLDTTIGRQALSTAFKRCQSILPKKIVL